MTLDDDIHRKLDDLQQAVDNHHKEWQSTVHRYDRSSRRVYVILVGFLAVIVGSYFYFMYTTTIPVPYDDAELGEGALLGFPLLSSYYESTATSTFDGVYAVDGGTVTDGGARYTIADGVIRNGGEEFRLQGDLDSDGRFRGSALWHEDMYDPGDCSIVNVQLHWANGMLHFTHYELGSEPELFLKLAPIER